MREKTRKIERGLILKGLVFYPVGFVLDLSLWAPHGGWWNWLGLRQALEGQNSRLVSLKQDSFNGEKSSY